MRKEHGFFTFPGIPDFDKDGIPDESDSDDDNDGVPDTTDPKPQNPYVPTVASDESDTSSSDSLEPGTAEHKADRWAKYQQRGGTWDYDHWSQNYDQNMVRTRLANAAADMYHQQIGWGEREVTVNVNNEIRRLDIADIEAQRAIEYKTGYIYKGPDINSEVRRDQILVQQGWEIEWVFEGSASEPLLNDLRDAGIFYRFRSP